MKKIIIKDTIQNGYYYLIEPISLNCHIDFKPQLTPKEILELGVFGGKHLTDCTNEFPSNWFKKVKLSPKGKDISLNYFQVDASLPLSHWQQKGWIHLADPRGWFQLYWCKLLIKF